MKKFNPFFKKCPSCFYKKFILLFLFTVSHFFSFACNRPNVSDLSGEEQQLLVNLILEFACESQDILDGKNGKEYHSDFGLHDLENLLSWHGDFIADLETFLLNNGGSDFVPLPEWNPCVRMPNVYYESESVCSDVDPIPPLERLEAPDCGGFSGDTYSCKSLCEFTEEVFFQEILSDHNYIHNVGVGGSMSMPGNAAGTAIFYPWHKYLDNIYKDYKNANFIDLDLEVEVIYDDCCKVELSTPKQCCLNIESAILEDATFISITSTSDGREIITFKKESAGTKKLFLTYENACGEKETLDTDLELNGSAAVPSIPDEPPYGFQHFCVENGASCYDFKWIKCLEGLEVSSSSFKLNAEVDGTELCLTSVFPKRQTVTLTVTPIGYCGTGESQQWTIYLNDPHDCGGFEGGGHFRLANDTDTDTDTDLISLYPNPVNNEFQVDYSLASETIGQLKIIDILGRIQYTRPINGNRGTANISSRDLDAGIYYLLLLDGEKIIESQKFVKN